MRSKKGTLLRCAIAALGGLWVSYAAASAAEAKSPAPAQVRAQDGPAPSSKARGVRRNSWRTQSASYGYGAQAVKTAGPVLDVRRLVAPMRTAQIPPAPMPLNVRETPPSLVLAAYEPPTQPTFNPGPLQYAPLDISAPRTAPPPEPVASQPLPPAPPPPEVTAAFNPPDAETAQGQAFMVQIGAFAQVSNAKAAQAKAAAIGPVSVEGRTAAGALIYRVRIGPWPNRIAAEGARREAVRLGFANAMIGVAY